MGELTKNPISSDQVELIQQQAAGLRYGTLSLVFQDGVLIQIDRNEKMRIPHSNKEKS